MPWTKNNKLTKVVSTAKLLKSRYQEILDKLLQPRDHLSLDTESEISDITDIFEEFHQESYLRPYAEPNKKYLSKTEADWKIAEQFTPEYKNAINDVKKELKITDSLFYEALNIGETNERKVINIPRKTKYKDDVITIEKQTCSSRRSSASTVDSKTWQLLEANALNKFQVSPPFFDAFHENRKHWLERPKISWKVIDHSRIKCESWLKHNHS